MIHPGAGDTSTVRSVFIIDPADKVRLTLTYPKSVGRNFDEILRVIDALQATDANPVATPADWRPGDRVVVAGTATAGAARSVRLGQEYRSPGGASLDAASGASAPTSARRVGTAGGS